MKLDGRRRSTNISDRRRTTGRSIGIGGGIVGIIATAVIVLLSGGNVSDAVSSVMSSSNTSMNNGEYIEDDQERYLYDLSSKVLAGTEDVWSKKFQEEGWGEYECPKMIIYHGSIETGCGMGSSQTGPFYCSADQTVYIDLDFFKNMQTDIGASGDFCYAYVIAHEVGHHVQYLLGTLDKAHQQMARLSETEANKISVRLELQADYYAGVWANGDNEMFQSIESGDVEAAINAASKIGDDYLQRKAYGREMPESFNHGRSSQRVRWLTAGLNSGDASEGDTFTPSYSNL